jgi:hypothetical protein
MGDREEGNTVTKDRAASAPRLGARRRPRRPGAVLAGLVVGAAVLADVVSAGSTAHGSGAALVVSVSSGPVGTVVRVTGDAGPGCVVAKNWSGFDFERYGEQGTGPATAMTTLVATNGGWTAHFIVTAGAPSAARAGYVGITATPDGQGYWLVRADGGIAAFGDARWYGSLPAAKARPVAPIVGMARTGDAKGYWLAGADGHVYGFGDARSYGSASAPITAIAAPPGGHGYWLVDADGHVYSFGAARFAGAPDGYQAPYDAIAALPAGGYVVTAASDAAVYRYAGGTLSGGGPGLPLAGTLVGAAVTPTGNGTWQVGIDGGIITSGDATFYGSLPGDSLTPDAPVTGITGTSDGHGYWLVGADGTVFSFGDAQFYGMVF